jgi:hypothetical protein
MLKKGLGVVNSVDHDGLDDRARHRRVLATIAQGAEVRLVDGAADEVLA